jgi:hypothetical protein
VKLIDKISFAGNIIRFVNIGTKVDDVSSKLFGQGDQTILFHETSVS